MERCTAIVGRSMGLGLLLVPYRCSSSSLFSTLVEVCDGSVLGLSSHTYHVGVRGSSDRRLTVAPVRFSVRDYLMGWMVGCRLMGNARTAGPFMWFGFDSRLRHHEQTYVKSRKRFDSRREMSVV